MIYTIHKHQIILKKKIVTFKNANISLNFLYKESCTRIIEKNSNYIFSNYCFFHFPYPTQNFLILTVDYDILTIPYGIIHLLLANYCNDFFFLVLSVIRFFLTLISLYNNNYKGGKRIFFFFLHNRLITTIFIFIICRTINL